MTILQQLKADVKKSSIEEICLKIIQLTNYIDYLSKKSPEEIDDKKENIHELITAMREYMDSNTDHTLSDWLQNISLSSEENQDENSGPKVSLMTLHMAKGLEFPRVHITGIEDGLIPHASNLATQKSIEEERRLLYVGMTRAKEKLSFYSAFERRFYDETKRQEQSRFLKDIPMHFFEPNREYERHVSHHQESQVTYSYDEPIIGMEVSHPTYGRGVIENLEAYHGEIKATVHFRNFGKKRISARQLNQV